MVIISKKMRVVLLSVVMILALGLCLQGCSDSSDAKQASAKSQEVPKPPEGNKTAQALYDMALEAAKADVEAQAPCMSYMGGGCLRSSGLNALSMLHERLGENADLSYDDKDFLIQYFATQYVKHYNYFVANGVD